MNDSGYFKPGDEVLFVRPCQPQNSGGFVSSGMVYATTAHSTPPVTVGIDLIKGKILCRYRNAELDAIYRIEHVMVSGTSSMSGMSIVYTVSYKDVYEEF